MGSGNDRGTTVAVDHGTADPIFGLVMMNDGSARDIQKWEDVPLGLFQGEIWVRRGGEVGESLKGFEGSCGCRRVQVRRGRGEGQEWESKGKEGGKGDTGANGSRIEEKRGSCNGVG